MLRSAVALQKLSRATQSNAPCLYALYSTESEQADGARPRKSSAKAKLLIALLGTTALTAGTLAYAKSNQDVRDVLKDYLPWTDDAIAIMYGERETAVSKAITTVSGFFGGSDTDKKPPLKIDVSKPLPSLMPLPPPKPTQTPKEAPVKKESPPVVEVKKQQPAITANENVTEIRAATNFTIAAYKHAANVLKQYSKKVDAILENNSDNINQQDIDELHETSATLKQAETSIQEAKKRLDEVMGGNDGPFAQQMKAEVKLARNEYDEANSGALLSQRYWPQIEQARKYFIEELKSLYPDAEVDAKKLDLKGANVDALLLLAMRRVLLYQQLLAKQELILNRRVDNALKGTEDDLIQTKIEIALDKERRKALIEQQNKLSIAEGHAKELLETELKKQLDIHMAHLNDLLDKRGNEVAKAERQAADEKAEVQRAEHELRLAAVLGRLQGVDDALKARSDADKMARQSQKLWAACEALESILKRDTCQPIPVSKELDGIATVAADSDELVSAVLRSVSNTVRERGVYSELALREKYNKIENACMRLALVPEEGGSLLVYVLSWLQSLFLVKGGEIPKDELDDKPTDYSELDTYDILHRIRYCVDRCNWTQAVKYSQLLNGAPKIVARDWTDEVLLHLEARQAARVLLAHASASGLLYS